MTRLDSITRTPADAVPAPAPCALSNLPAASAVTPS